MSSGYSRQSAAEIIPSAVVKSSSFNAELNKLRDAFDFSTDGTTGHTHDGSSDEGSYVPLIADIDGNNKAVVNTTNNRIEFYVSVGDSPIEQVRIQDGAIVPVTDSDVDLGTSTLEFKDLYLDGTAKVDTLNVDENASVAGTLDVTGDTTVVNLEATGTLDVTGLSTLATVSVTTEIDVPTPTENTHAVTKIYVDGLLSEATAEALSITTLGETEPEKAVTTDAEGNTLHNGQVQARLFLERDAPFTGTTPSLNVSSASYFYGTLTGDTTFTFDYSGVDLTTNAVLYFTLEVIQDSTPRTITWPVSVEWEGGSAPEVPASNNKAIYVFFTRDGGTVWVGFQAGVSFS